MNIKSILTPIFLFFSTSHGMFQSAKLKPIDKNFVPMIAFSEAKEIAFNIEENQHIPSLAAQTTKVLSNQLLEVANNDLIDQWSSYENRTVPIEPSFMTMPIKELPGLFASQSNLLALNRQLHEETQSNSLAKAFITITFAITENDRVGKQLFSFLFKQPVRMRNHNVIEIIGEKSIRELFFYIKTMRKIKFKVDWLECLKSSPEEVQTLYLLNKLYKQQNTETKGAQLIGCPQSIIDTIHHLSPELRFQLFHNHKLYIYKEESIINRFVRGSLTMNTTLGSAVGCLAISATNACSFIGGYRYGYSGDRLDAIKPVLCGFGIVIPVVLILPLITAPSQRTGIKTDDYPKTSPSTTVAVPLHYV